MILLDNECLPTLALNKIVSLLVASAKEGNQNGQVVHSVTNEMLAVLQSYRASIRPDWDRSKDQLLPINPDDDVRANKAIRIDNHIINLTNNMPNIRQRTSNATCKHPMHYMISLDDAVTALKGIPAYFEKTENIMRSENQTVTAVKGTGPPNFRRHMSTL